MHVVLKVYSPVGQEIATLLDEDRQRGTHRVECDVSSFRPTAASGLYYYSLATPDRTLFKKMLLMK